MSTLQDTAIVIVGGSSGIARRIATDAAQAGADVVLVGRTTPEPPETTGPGRITVSTVDLGDEASIERLAAEVGAIDHVVSVAANHGDAPVAELRRDAVVGAFDAKVVGPLLLAKHLGPQVREGGSFVLFSGVVAWRPSRGLAVMAATNGAVDFLVRALAVDLAPVRVNAVSPGIVDSGAWDAMGDGKSGFLRGTAEANPVGRVGDPEDVARAVLFLLTDGYVTGDTLHVDGGGRL